MKTLTFMPAKAEDAEVIYAQCKELVQRYEDPNLVDMDRVLSWLDRKIRTNITQYTCVFRGNEKVAFFSMSEQEDGWELDDLYVLEPYRNQGIGSRILKYCVEMANGPIYLYVFTTNVGAIQLYARHGFAVTQQVSPTRIIMSR